MMLKQILKGRIATKSVVKLLKINVCTKQVFFCMEGFVHVATLILKLKNWKAF